MVEARLANLEEAFKAFADPTRLRILGLLAGGEICVCNIHECLDVPQPTASRHLAYLRKKHLVETRKDGLWVHYRLARLDEPVMRVLLSAVTHVLRHCDAVTKDRQRLEAQNGMLHSRNVVESRMLRSVAADQTGATGCGGAGIGYSTSRKSVIISSRSPTDDLICKRWGGTQ